MHFQEVSSLIYLQEVFFYSVCEICVCKKIFSFLNLLVCLLFFIYQCRKKYFFERESLSILKEAIKMSIIRISQLSKISYYRCRCCNSISCDLSIFSIYPIKTTAYENMKSGSFIVYNKHAEIESLLIEEFCMLYLMLKSVKVFALHKFYWIKNRA